MPTGANHQRSFKSIERIGVMDLKTQDKEHMADVPENGILLVMNLCSFPLQELSRDHVVRSSN